MWWPSSWIFFHTKKNLNFIRVHLLILPVVALKKTPLSTFFIWSYIKQSPVMATILDYQFTWILLRTIQGIIESIFPINSVVLQKYNFSNIFHIGFNFKYLSCNGDHLGFLIHMKGAIQDHSCTIFEFNHPCNFYEKVFLHLPIEPMLNQVL